MNIMDLYIAACPLKREHKIQQKSVDSWTPK